jgi:hypothetical protein
MRNSSGKKHCSTRRVRITGRCTMTWTIEGKQVRFPNGTTVTFEFEIQEIVEVDGVLVVILEIPPNRMMTENVFGISTEGKLLWQIERTAANSTDPANKYTGFTGHDQKIVRIYNWNGTSNAVDARTGKVLSTGIAK